MSGNMCAPSLVVSNLFKDYTHKAGCIITKTPEPVKFKKQITYYICFALIY